MIVMETLTVFGELLNPWIYAILFKTATTSTWKDTFMILSQPKGSTEKTPHLGSQGNHPRSAENDAARSKLKKSPTEHQQPTYRELCAKAKTLIRERHEFTSAHLTQISRGSLNPFVPFLISSIKRGPSLKLWAPAMAISRALRHQRLNRSPSCLTLILCRSSLPHQRSALCQHLSRPHTPH